MVPPLNRLGWCLVLPILGAVGCGKQETSASEKRASTPAAVVVVEAVSRATLTTKRTFLGEVQARADAQLSTAESGRVRRVVVKEGDQVKAGTLLLELDDGLARAELTAARAEERQVKVTSQYQDREAARFGELQRDQVVSSLDAEREIAEAARLAVQHDGAQATVRVQSERVSRHRITAPFDGTIAGRAVDPGDWLAAGQVALQLLSPDRVEVMVRVPEGVLPELERVSRMTLGTGVHEVSARLAGVVNALERATRTALVRIEPATPQKWLIPGAPVTVSLEIERSGGVVVPRDALVYGVSGVRVVSAIDGKARPIPVTIVAKNESHALVSASDLTLGSMVVTRGNERLRPEQALTLEAPVVPESVGQ